MKPSLWSLSLCLLLALSFVGADVAATVAESPAPEPTPRATDGPIRRTHVRAADGAVMVPVPAGEFTLGSPADDDPAGNEHPQQVLWVSDFWMDVTEVTNQQFALFVDATGYRTDAERVGYATVYLDRHWVGVPGADWRHPAGPGTGITDTLKYPVVQVSWNDARSYCTWAGARLPTEAEWEKAARGTDGRLYPWGNDFDGRRLNFCDSRCAAEWRDASIDDGFPETAPVGSYPDGASAYGGLDMAGNVAEWTSSLFRPYPYRLSDGREDPAAAGLRILRGGSWSTRARRVHTTARDEDDPGDAAGNIGFRCALTGESQ